MSSRILVSLVGATILVTGCRFQGCFPATRGASSVPAAAGRVLRVCADPNNLPFSNEKREGFENRIAELVARDMHARVTYTWWAQRRGFTRNTLKAGACDVLLGVPTGFEQAFTTRPYYRSTYVFVTRSDGPQVASFDDPVLRRVRVGVQLIGSDRANSPPAHALSARHIVNNVRGYTVYGDYRHESPPAEIVRAVARNEIDVGVVWGPLAGFYARRQPIPLRLSRVTPEVDPPFLPFVFDISMGVRQADRALREELDGILEKRQAEIDRVLDDYGVPRLDLGGGDGSGGR